jgi:hypothetical protein
MAFADPVPAGASASPAGFVVSTKVDEKVAAAQREQQANTPSGDAFVITPDTAAEPVVIAREVDPDAGLVLYTGRSEAPSTVEALRRALPSGGVPVVPIVLAAIGALAVVGAGSYFFYRSQMRALRGAAGGASADSSGSSDTKEVPK